MSEEELNILLVGHEEIIAFHEILNAAAIFYSTALDEDVSALLYTEVEELIKQGNSQLDSIKLLSKIYNPVSDTSHKLSVSGSTLTNRRKITTIPR